MKRIGIILFALTLSACGTVNPFQSVTNPISGTNLYEAELVFDASVKTFNELRGLCARRVLRPTCRTYVVQGQNIIRNAYAADLSARNFVKNNPTIDATNVIQAFVGIVSDFKNTVAVLSATK